MTSRALSGMVLVLAACLAVEHAHAISKGTIGKMNVSQSGRTASVSYPSPSNTGGSQIPVSPVVGGWTQAGNYGVPQGAVPAGQTGTLMSDGKVYFRTPGGHSLDGVQYPLRTSAPIPWGALAPVAAGLVCVVTTAGVCAVAAGAAAALPGVMDWAKKAGIEPDGEGHMSAPPESEYPVSDGYQYRYTVIGQNSPWLASRSAACYHFSSIVNQYAPTYGYVSGRVELSGVRCNVYMTNSSGVEVPNGYSDGQRTGSPCGVGEFVKPDGTCSATGNARRKFTQQEFADKLRDVTPPDGRPWGEVIDRGGEIPMPTPTVSGPSSVSGPQREVTRPDGSRDVTSTTYHFSTTNNTVTNTHITNVTNHYNSSNVQTGSTTETVTPTDNAPGPESGTDEGTEEDSASDTPLGELPKLYERKYPDGIVGIWGDFKDRLSGSSLAQFATGLMPSYDGGTCPSWMVSLNLGHIGFGITADFGTHDVAPPCWIWDALRAILIVCALLLARALIFGG